MTVFGTDAHVEEGEETFAALQDRPELSGAAPRVIEGERRAFWLIEGRTFPRLFGSVVPETTKAKILANGAAFFRA